jgi:hypothetical protein
MRRASLGLLFVLFSGCSGGDFSVPASPSDSSTAGGDTSLTDAAGDTAREDTSVGDTGVGDTSVDDTGVADAHKKDSGLDATADGGGLDAMDSAVFDTGVDSGKPDSGAPDSGAPDTAKVDTGPMCPMPTNTRVAMPAGSDCMTLTSALLNAFDGARACSCDADCSVLGSPGGCACGSYVNPGSDAYPEYLADSNAYAANACKPKNCPLLPCVIVSPACVAGKCAAPGTGTMLDAGL